LRDETWGYSLVAQVVEKAMAFKGAKYTSYGYLSSILVFLVSLTGASTVTLTPVPSISYQAISGFGICEAFQRAYTLTNLSSQMQSQVMSMLFSPTTGAGLSILRIGLGSSPNSTLDHMNSIEPVGPVTPSSMPTYVWDGIDSGQVWVATQARDVFGLKTFYADAWSAPGYMKTNGRDDLGGWLCGVRGEGSAAIANGTVSLCQGQNWIEAYATYLVRYVRFYRENAGIPIGYLGFLNEPNLV
jgi:O-glycosyl hydrolase